MRISAGRFAALHQVSKKTLRHYKEIGLLEPAGIDPGNGYAYYDEPQQIRMRRIRYLRLLHFPLEEIRMLLGTGPEAWGPLLQRRLETVRSQGRLLRGLELELVALQERIENGEELYPVMSSKTIVSADTLELKEPVFIIGYGARVPYNKQEEKQPMIDGLIERFFGDDAPGRIPNRRVPRAQFGIVGEYEPDTGIGTYMMGVQVTSLDEIPEGMRSFTLPQGLYARITLEAVNQDALVSDALFEGYRYLYDTWLPASAYREAEMMAVEAYFEDVFELPVNPQMEIWTRIIPK